MGSTRSSNRGTRAKGNPCRVLEAKAVSARCPWCGDDPLYVRYHDEEWGVPVHDDRRLFEFLTLEAAQAGLSWITILRKRESYREAFAHFDPEAVAKLDPEKLMENAGLVRNRAKLKSSVNNARAFLSIQEEFGSFSAYQWRFVDGQTVHNRYDQLAEVPAQTPVSQAFSKDLKQRGFAFLGPVVLYAHMQACGMVNDHLTTCFRHTELATGGN